MQLKLALKLRPEIGPEQGVLLVWIEEHREGWPDLEEEDVKSRRLALLVGFGELPPKLCIGGGLQLTRADLCPPYCAASAVA